MILHIGMQPANPTRQRMPFRKPLQSTIGLGDRSHRRPVKLRTIGRAHPAFSYFRCFVMIASSEYRHSVNDSVPG